MSTVIEAVVFDFGGVLTLAPLDHHFETLRTLCGLDRQTFELEYSGQRPDYDRGAINSREYWSRVINSRGQPPDDEIFGSLFEADVAGWTRINEPVLGWSQRLREAGMRTAILSNMPREILDRIETHFRWLDRFEVKIFSCDLGVNKPDPRIFQACLDALSLEAAKVLFLDDVHENVDGAQRTGIRSVLFRNLDDALQQITEGGWLPANLTSEQELG